MGEPCKAVMFHGLGQGGRGDVVACGGGGGGDDRVSDSESATGLSSGVVSSGSLFSSRSSLTDDDATSPPEGGRKSSSSLSSSDSMQLDGGGADGGPLYELAPLLAHLRQDRAVQVLPRDVPVLHIAIRSQMRRRPRKEDHPLHQQDEGVQRLCCCRAKSEPEFALRPRAVQQDDYQEDTERFV